MNLELDDLNSINSFVTEFKQKFDQLHLLFNNAGVIQDKYETSKQGLEKTFAVNHLGHFYLTNLLLELLAKSYGRIINTSAVVKR